MGLATIARPSLQGRVALVYSGDPALQPRPEDLPEDAAPADVTERTAQQERWDHAIKVARDSGDWNAVTRDGERPTVFHFQLPHGVARHALIEAMQTGEVGGAILGWSQRFALVFRCLLRSVTNFNDHEVRLTRHKGLGIDMAQEAIADDLLDIGRVTGVGDAILIELGDLLLKRLAEPTPGK